MFSEFNTSFLTLRDYAIINDDIEGQLPNMTFNGNEVVVTLCCRSDEDSNSTMALPSVFPFYLIKVSNVCLALELETYLSVSEGVSWV